MYLCGSLVFLVEFKLLLFCVRQPVKQKTKKHFVQKNPSCGWSYEILKISYGSFLKFGTFLPFSIYTLQNFLSSDLITFEICNRRLINTAVGFFNLKIMADLFSIFLSYWEELIFQVSVFLVAKH